VAQRLRRHTRTAHHHDNFHLEIPTNLFSIALKSPERNLTSAISFYVPASLSTTTAPFVAPSLVSLTGSSGGGEVLLRNLCTSLFASTFGLGNGSSKKGCKVMTKAREAVLRGITLVVFMNWWKGNPRVRKMAGVVAEVYILLQSVEKEKVMEKEKEKREGEDETESEE
jgi:spore maturation protein SpmA